MMNIMNPPADWSTLKKLIWLRGTPITGGEELTVSGTPPLSLPNSLGKPLKAWKVALSPYQEGSGDPSPDNVRPIHGTDKVTVWTGGENWSIGAQYDKSATGMSVTAQADGTAKFNNQATSTFNYYWYSNSVSYSNGIWLPAGKYTFSVRLLSGTATNVGGGGFGLFYWYTDDTGTRLNTQKTLSFPSSKTVTFSKDVRVQPVIYFDTSAVCTDAVVAFMIERGETASDHYIPYVAPSQTVITLPQTVYAGTVGSEGGESRGGMVVYNGTESWTKDNDTVGSGFYHQINAFARYSDYSTLILCDKLTPYPHYNSNSYKNAEQGITGYPTNAYYPGVNWIYAKAPNCTTAAEFKAWLAENPITVVYPLATQTQFPLTAPSIPTPKGTATTWAVAEDGNVESMSVTYIGKSSS